MSKNLKIFLNRHFALIIALMFGALVAMLMFVMPEWRLASFFHMLGIDRLTDKAQPPFGRNATFLASALAGLLTVVALWPVGRFVERFLGGKAKQRPKARVATVIPSAPKVSAADAHPDAPPRRPIFAETELGAPLMSEEALVSDGELILGARDEALDVVDVAMDPLPSTIVAPAEETYDPYVAPIAPVKTPAPVFEAPAPEVANAPREANPESIDVLINRLDSALRGRAVRYSANPDASAGMPGDIVSLRQALRSFGGAH